MASTSELKRREQSLEAELKDIRQRRSFAAKEEKSVRNAKKTVL